MPYEIPKNLRYEEKIVFGLTFWQFAWLAVFGGMAAIVFFKLPLGIYLKAPLSVLFLVLGVGFGFLDFSGHLRRYNAFRKSVREAGFMDKRLKDFVEVKKIENDAIYLANGSLKAVLEVTPINFSILGDEEKRAVIGAYRDFLNSLDFPIQIVMRTTQLNLDDYLFELKQNVWKLNNRELEEQFESFKEFVQQFIEKNSVRNRLFYVVVPFSPYSYTDVGREVLTVVQNLFSRQKRQGGVAFNREIALNQLDIRAQLCQEKLKRCQLETKRLNSKELQGLLASFFDSCLETGNDYLFPITLLEKFEGEEECKGKQKRP